MKWTLYPSTKSGVLSISCMVMAGMLMVVVAFLGEDMKHAIDGRFFDHLNLAVMTLLAFAFSVVSLVFGLLALFRDKDHAGFLLLSLILALVSVFFGTSLFLEELSAMSLQTK